MMRLELVELGRGFVEEQMDLFKYVKSLSQIDDKAAQSMATGAWIEAKIQYYHLYTKKQKEKKDG